MIHKEKKVFVPSDTFKARLTNTLTLMLLYAGRQTVLLGIYHFLWVLQATRILYYNKNKAILRKNIVKKKITLSDTALSHQRDLSSKCQSMLCLFEKYFYIILFS